jgi:hypothetical protein
MESTGRNLSSAHDLHQSLPHDIHRSRQKREPGAKAAMIRARKNYRSSSYTCVVLVPDVGPAQQAKWGSSYFWLHRRMGVSG